MQDYSVRKNINGSRKKTGARKKNDRRLTTHGQGTAKKYEGQEEATRKSKDGHGRKACSVPVDD